MNKGGKLLSMTLGAAIVAAALTYTVLQAPQPWPAEYPQPAGIVYGMKLEGVNQDSTIRATCKELAAAIISESQPYSCPDVIAKIKAASPGCRVGLEVSAWGGWIRPSKYWALRSEFGRQAALNNWWLRYRDGTPVVLGGLGLVDVTRPDALDWYVRAVRAKRDSIGPDFLFVDELHRTLDFLPGADSIVVFADPLASPARRDSLWAVAETRFCRRVGRHLMVNGTFEPWRAPTVITGMYVQNALSSRLPWTKIFWWHQETDHPFIIIESFCSTLEDQKKLVGLAALCGAAYQVTTARTGWRYPMEQPWPARSWGAALSEPNTLTRRFQRAEVNRSGDSVSVRVWADSTFSQVDDIPAESPRAGRAATMERSPESSPISSREEAPSFTMSLLLPIEAAALAANRGRRE